MAGWMKHFFSPKPGKQDEAILRFSAKIPQESIKELPNPACGWYQIHTFPVEQAPDLDELGWCIDPADRIALVLFHIGAYRQKPLDESALEHMRVVLAFFSDRQIEIVLRIVYDNEGKGMEHEPSFYDQVEEHIRQIGPLLREFSGQIYIFQGLLVGSWGEMHTSKFLSNERLTRTRDLLRAYLDGQTFLAFRRPMFYRRLYKDQKPENRAGLYDDGMFGSPTHLGTFGNETRSRAGWVNAWTREEELDFEDELCQNAPNGGEAVLGEQERFLYTLEETAALLAKMHVSYLNRVHDARVLDCWKEMTWEKKDAWRGTDGCTYIGRHLGCRFRISGAEADFHRDTEKTGTSVMLTITVQNDGFAPCYQEAEAYVRIGENTVWIPSDVRTWKSGKETMLLVDLPLADGAVYFGIRRSSDGRPIYLAHECEEDGSVKIGEFLI